MKESKPNFSEIHLVEYKQLKSEQVSRIGFRDNLIYAMLAAFGAVFSYAVSTDGTKEALLVIPVISFVIGWTYLNNDAKISHIANYIRDELSKKLATDPSIFAWENYNKTTKKRKLRKYLQFIVDILTFFGTGAFSLIIFLFSAESAISGLIQAATIFNIVILLILLVSFSVYTNI